MKTIKTNAVAATSDLPIRVHHVPNLFHAGIRPSPEFAKKGLCDFGVNIGAKCGHDCTYCSTGATIRTQKLFTHLGESPFGTGYAIVDETTPARVANDAARIPPSRRGLIQLCTFTDAWAPEALPAHLGRNCLQAVLSQPV